MSEKVYGWRKKIVRIFFCQKFFWSEKNLGLKEEFGLKKTFVGKFFWSEGQVWHFRGSVKHFAFFMVCIAMRCILCIVFYTLYSMPIYVHVQFSMFCAFYFIHCILCILLFAIYILCIVFYYIHYTYCFLCNLN